MSLKRSEVDRDHNLRKHIRSPYTYFHWIMTLSRHTQYTCTHMHIETKCKCYTWQTCLFNPEFVVLLEKVSFYSNLYFTFNLKSYLATRTTFENGTNCSVLFCCEVGKIINWILSWLQKFLMEKKISFNFIYSAPCRIVLSTIRSLGLDVEVKYWNLQIQFIVSDTTTPLLF